MKGSGGRKEKGEMMQFYFNMKNKRIRVRISKAISTSFAFSNMSTYNIACVQCLN